MSFKGAYSKLLSLEMDRSKAFQHSDASLFEDPADLDEVLATPQFDGAVAALYDGEAAEAEALAELQADVANATEEEVAPQDERETLGRDDAAPAVTTVRRPGFP